MKSYDLFISHVWGSNYNELTKLLEDRGYFTYRDYSVPEQDPLDFDSKKNLYDKIKEQIRQSSCVLVLGSMVYYHSEWMKKEMEIAKEYEKKIIVVCPRGQERVPIELQNITTDDLIVRWNADSIVEAIRAS